MQDFHERDDSPIFDDLEPFRGQLAPVNEIIDARNQNQEINLYI